MDATVQLVLSLPGEWIAPIYPEQGTPVPEEYKSTTTVEKKVTSIFSSESAVVYANLDSLYRVSDSWGGILEDQQLGQALYAVLDLTTEGQDAEGAIEYFHYRRPQSLIYLYTPERLGKEPPIFAPTGYMRITTGDPMMVQPVTEMEIIPNLMELAILILPSSVESTTVEKAIGLLVPNASMVLSVPNEFKDEKVVSLLARHFETLSLQSLISDDKRYYIIAMGKRKAPLPTVPSGVGEWMRRRLRSLPAERSLYRKVRTHPMYEYKAALAWSVPLPEL